MSKKLAIIIAVVALFIGHGVGYAVGVNNPHISKNITEVPMGMHRMPDGSMMSNGGQTMSMADMMSSMNAELKGKTGDEFDKAFLAEMIVHHQGAVGMAEAALTNAKHKEIKDLAAAIISAQNKEISDMQKWAKTWYGIAN